MVHKCTYDEIIIANGRDSYVVAGEVLDKAEEELIEFQLFR